MFIKTVIHVTWFHTPVRIRYLIDSLQPLPLRPSRFPHSPFPFSLWKYINHNTIWWSRKYNLWLCLQFLDNTKFCSGCIHWRFLQFTLNLTKLFLIKLFENSIFFLQETKISVNLYTDYFLFNLFCKHFTFESIFWPYASKVLKYIPIPLIKNCCRIM